jgi:hypothetical protein
MALNNEVRMRLSQMLRQWDHEHRRHSYGTIDNETGPVTMFLTVQNRRDLKKYLDEKAADNTTFSEMVLHRIDQAGKKDADVYNAAGISRSIFSNLRNNRNYQPSRETALCLTIALEMTLEESEQLLEKAGFALSDDRRFDQIIRFCIMNEIYDIMDINYLLYENGEQTILLKGDKKDLR